MATQWHWIKLGETLAGYGISDAGTCGLTLVPTVLKAQVAERVQPVDSLVQVALTGDTAAKGFLNGTSMHNSEATTALHYVAQRIEHDGEATCVVTTLASEQLRVTHRLCAYPDQTALTVAISVENIGTKAVTLEHVDSFALSRLSPFQTENVPGSLTLTRYRSKWAQEARPETVPIEALALEPSWKPSGGASERFGQVGSMPVRGWFPYVAIHDDQYDVTWAATLETPTSWQLEAFRKQDDLIIAGGQADWLAGHWRINLAPGASYSTPRARVTVGKGAPAVVGQALQQLTKQTLLARGNADAKQLPIMFNEFCQSWGHPTQANITAALPLLAEHGVDTFVIDAGWHANAAGQWEGNFGDWQPNAAQFPDGLKAMAARIRDAGMVPGLWFEPENVGPDAIAYQQTDHLLHRDGQVITAGTRRFWDMQEPFVQAYLKQRVIDLLRQAEFGYVKFDYNDNIGVGCDGADSLGAGLAQQGLAQQAFVRRVREALPDIVIENCASGGHRLEPSQMALSDVSSFSDAHEAACIPLIAGHLHALMLPQQELIWAVLRPDDDTQRLQYSLAATFLGRMCLSGDVNALKPAQWAVVDDAIAFYRQVIEVIKTGVSYRYGTQPLSYQHPTGAQVLDRHNDHGRLLVYHRFGGKDEPLSVAVDAKRWRVAATFGDMTVVNQTAQTLTFASEREFVAGALYLEARADDDD